MEYISANSFGFLPKNSGVENRKALQQVVDKTGTIYVNQPGEYKIAGSVYIGSHTTIKFGNGVFLKKVNEIGKFSHVLLNKGALTKSYDEHIKIENLYIIVNDIDVRKYEVFGLNGQIAFHYIKDLVIEGFRCMDLGKLQFGIHICTFEDIIIRDVIIKGDKDGIHLGKGKRFVISNGIFETFDDAIALNAQDFDIGNPEVGWIEDGVVENCYDLDDKKEQKVGYFCRVLAGGWHDWYKGIEVQKSDTVVSDGKIYRVSAEPDGTKYISSTKPTHSSGEKIIDGICWVMTQDTVEYTVGVRNIAFRNIFLSKPRVGFAFHFSDNRYNRSYYKGAKLPIQKKMSLDNIRILHDKATELLAVGTPLDYISVTNSCFENTKISFYNSTTIDDYLVTHLIINGCIFNGKNLDEIIDNEIKNKIIKIHSLSNVFINIKKQEEE